MAGENEDLQTGGEGGDHVQDALLADGVGVHQHVVQDEELGLVGGQLLRHRDAETEEQLLLRALRQAGERIQFLAGAAEPGDLQGLVEENVALAVAGDFGERGGEALLQRRQRGPGGRLLAVLDQVKKLERELAALKGKLASAQGDDMVSLAVDIKGAKVLAAMLEGADINALRETMDKLKDKLKSAAVVLASVLDGKVTLIAGVTPDLIGRVKAGELVNMVALQVGGKGGGRPDMAQAGGTQPENLAQALASVKGWVEGKL